MIFSLSLSNKYNVKQERECIATACSSKEWTLQMEGFWWKCTYDDIFYVIFFCDWSFLFMCVIQMLLNLWLFHFWMRIMSWIFGAPFWTNLRVWKMFFRKIALGCKNVGPAARVLSLLGDLQRVGCFLWRWHQRLGNLVSHGVLMRWVDHGVSLGGNKQPWCWWCNRWIFR